MKFTIITVTYNLINAGRKETFLQSINSVLAQTYRDIEHIVIDGGSTDGTVDILQDLQASDQITRFISEPDKGIYDAMNKGVFLASGEFLLFLNSDDFYHNPNGLAEMAAALETGADFCYSPVRHLGANDEVCHVSKPKPIRFLAGMPFNHPGLAVRRRAFEELGGFDTSFKIAGDFDFIIRMYLAGFKGIGIDTDFVSFRAGGVSADGPKSKAETGRLWHKNLARFRNFPESVFVYEAARKTLPLPLLWVMWRSKTQTPFVRKAALYQCWRTLRKRPLASLKYYFLRQT